MTRIVSEEFGGTLDRDHGHSDAPSALPIAALLLTYNEELNLDRCLSSVVGWCAAIHVVDSGSTDATRKICESYNAVIHTHNYVDSASQWDWAFRNVAIAEPWL